PRAAAVAPLAALRGHGGPDVAHCLDRGRRDETAAPGLRCQRAQPTPIRRRLDYSGQASGLTGFCSIPCARSASVRTAPTIDIRPMPLPIEMFWRKTRSTNLGETTTR